jgi:hypothetical protein
MAHTFQTAFSVSEISLLFMLKQEYSLAEINRNGVKCLHCQIQETNFILFTYMIFQAGVAACISQF